MIRRLASRKWRNHPFKDRRMRGSKILSDGKGVYMIPHTSLEKRTVTHVEQAERDAHGRWRRGSGNPAGPPRGAKNRQPRRRAGDRERAAEWTGNDWRVFYRRMFQDADGGPAEKHGAAFAECAGLWLLLNLPSQLAGLCAYCGKALDVPLSSMNGAPIRIDGAWVHWTCLPWFSRARWDTAKMALQRLGITGQTF